MNKNFQCEVKHIPNGNQESVFGQRQSPGVDSIVNPLVLEIQEGLQSFSAKSFHAPKYRFLSSIGYIPIKRIFDAFFSLCALLFLSPIFILIALAIKLYSPGNPFYAHERVGRGGKTFKCYKFRTMYPDADEKLQTILDENPELLKEWNSTHKLKNDPRVTPVGKFLRSTSLDELPQFWNVLKGDLSVVGPRPVVFEEIHKHLGVKAKKILSIRPGITGIWQVSGRSDTSYETRIKMDEHYVDNYALALDLQLVFKTLFCMINSRGAY